MVSNISYAQFPNPWLGEPGRQVCAGSRRLNLALHAMKAFRRTCEEGFPQYADLFQSDSATESTLAL
jgi:hypothetical protein